MEKIGDKYSGTAHLYYSPDANLSYPSRESLQVNLVLELGIKLERRKNEFKLIEIYTQKKSSSNPFRVFFLIFHSRSLPVL